MGNVIVLGRKTLEGFPNGLPLQGRDNIILSRDKGFDVRGGRVAHSKEELFDILVSEYNDRQIFVVGGGVIYNMLLPYCHYAHVTKINYKYEADTFFPNLEKMDNWKLVGDSDEHTYFDLEFYYYKYENMNVEKIK
jgi:dihydrofolate reductase